MPKLSKKQERFLIWLSWANTRFEICRQSAHSYGKKSGLHTYVNNKGIPFKFDIRTLEKLIEEELVTSEYVYYFGIKYEYYYLTQAGQVYVHVLAISI